jgi:hypothetical protein
MFFKDKFELFSKIDKVVDTDNKNELTMIIQHIYYMKNFGKLCKYNLTDDEIYNLENRFGLFLNNYRKYERDINDELSKLNEKFEINKFLNLLDYINSCNGYFDDKYDKLLMNNIKTKLRNK